MAIIETDSHTEQRMQNLKRANDIRIANARLKAHMRWMTKPEGCVRAAEVLENPTEAQLSLPVGRLLRYIPKVGHYYSVPWLNKAGIRSSDRRLRDLTERQRLVLAEALREHDCA